MILSNLKVIAEDANALTYKIPCPLCGIHSELTVNKNELETYKKGALIQRAFPNLSNGQRELLLTGICPKCWNDMFKEEDE